jgi:endonuclease-3 related protein
MRPRELYTVLLEHFGPQHWWPGDSPFEVMVGAVLTQQANWSNAEKAISNLKRAGMLSPGSMAASGTELEELIRPSGFYRQKAGYLRELCGHIMEKYDGDLDAMFSRPLSALRPELLELRGVGPETADSILLYAGGKPAFVVDAYTVRICRRTGVFGSAKYDEVKEFFEENLKPDVSMFNEFHALLVRLGKEHCRARNPKCAECPVRRGCGFRKSGRPGSRRPR